MFACSVTVIELTTFINAPIHVCFDLSLSIDLELEAMNAYDILAIGGVRTGSIRLHERVCWQARQFGVPVTHESEITRLERPAFFQDTMVTGIFEKFQHDHFFRSVGPGRTEMRDVLQFGMPVWLLGTVSEKLIVRRRLSRLLTDRNRVIKQHAEVGLR